MKQEVKVTKSQYFILLGFGLLLLVLGLAMMIFGYFFIQDALASRNWDVVEGEVRNILVRRDTDTGTNRSSGEWRYFYVVSYAYEYDEENYTNNRYSLGEGSTASKNFDTEEEARDAGSDEYPIGSEVDVYVDPDDPESTVLQPGTNFGTFVPLVMGAFFFPGGVFLIWSMRRLQAKQNRQPF